MAGLHSQLHLAVVCLPVFYRVGSWSSPVLPGSTLTGLSSRQGQTRPTRRRYGRTLRHCKPWLQRTSCRLLTRPLSPPSAAAPRCDVLFLLHHNKQQSMWMQCSLFTAPSPPCRLSYLHRQSFLSWLSHHDTWLLLIHTSACIEDLDGLLKLFTINTAHFQALT